MLEGQEWDSISAALAHCELYTPLVKFSAFSVFLFFLNRVAKPSCLTERLLGTRE